MCEKGIRKPEDLRCSSPANDEELLSIDGERGKVVLTASRIDRGKRVTEIPEVAKLVPEEADFYLVGSTGPYLRRILDLIEEGSKGLRNFHLEMDVPKKRILELMFQASIYLHPPLAEHFGIAIVLRPRNRPRARGLQGRGRVD